MSSITYVEEQNGLHHVMIKSKGVIGDYSIKSVKSKRVAENFSQNLNKKFSIYERFDHEFSD